MPSLKTIKNWVDDAYNNYLMVEIHETEQAVHLTNESAAHSVDIHPENDEFTITGENYGEAIDKSCDANKDALLETLACTI